MLVVKGWETASNDLNVGVNNAIALPVEGDCRYVEPASSAFQALSAELEQLEDQMANLGIAILARQKNVAESGLSKQMDRADTNSMLSVLSQDLEANLQRSVNWVAQFAGIEAPTVVLDRDFNSDPIVANEITAYLQLFTNGVIDHRTLLNILRRGEVFSDEFDAEAIIDASEQELDGEMVPPTVTTPFS
jgi:hypothetical protein